MIRWAEQANGGESFTLGYVPGATPGKWARVWRQRLPHIRLDLIQVEAADVPDQLRSGAIDAAIGRLPQDKDIFHVIGLYEELPVVVVGRDHALAALDMEEEASNDDIASDVVNLPWDDVLYSARPAGPAVGPAARPVAGAEAALDHGAVPHNTVPHNTAVPGVPAVAYREDGSVDTGQPAPRPSTTAQAVAWVAQGAGITIVPMSLARLHHRKDVTYRVLGAGPTSQVGLIWLREPAQPDLVEEMVGIVRGRTARSSRGRQHSAAGQDGSSLSDATASPSRRTQGNKAGGGSTAGGKAGGQAAAGQSVSGKSGSGQGSSGKAPSGKASSSKAGAVKAPQGAGANRAARKARLAQQKSAGRRPKRR